VCLVVGGCAGGFDPERNKTADVICTVSDAEPLGAGAAPAGPPLQLFWEAFPSSDGPDCRTTYMCGAPAPVCASACAGGARSQGCRSAAPQASEPGPRHHPTCPSSSPSSPAPPKRFTYCDAQAFRPSLEDMFEDYWQRLPAYQGLGPEGVDGLDFRRLLFAFFPTYKASPLAPGFDRWAFTGGARARAFGCAGRFQPARRGATRRARGLGGRGPGSRAAWEPQPAAPQPAPMALPRTP
jgi:hypothetical protein